MIKIPIARLWHKKGKLEYFCIKQLIEYFPNINFEWHIVLHSPEYKDEWTEKINQLPINITWYSTQDMLSYIKKCDYADEILIDKIQNFVHFYHIIIFHYLRKVLCYDYAIAYEYDIIFNSNDLKELEECIKNKIPFGIIEPINSNCDKALYQKLCTLFQVDIKNYISDFDKGINAGFQGMNLKIFDHFLNPTSFNSLLECFDFSGIYNSNNEEKIGWERTIIDTQEQSFHSLMNRVYSDNFKILNSEEYYFYPSYVNMDILLKSKVLHYFGHVKPKQMIDSIEKKLIEYEYTTQD